MSNKTIERAHWTELASLSRLPQIAGVPVNLLRRLAVKELVDNALDAGSHVSVSEPSPGRYIIEDDGDGFPGDPEAIARLFTIDRPLVSSKLWRKPTRGALGNGLRVVAGVLIGSGDGARLVIHTRGLRIGVTPLEDGGQRHTVVQSERKSGTRIEISFGRYLPADPQTLLWGRQAIEMASGGLEYSGKPSLWHHDPDSLYELLRGSGERSLRDFLTEFDGCSGATAGKVARAWPSRSCHSMSREDATDILIRAREYVSPVSHRRLGAVGQLDHLSKSYSKKLGEIDLGVKEVQACIPFVVEAWASRSKQMAINLHVNRTPITGDVTLRRQLDKSVAIFGCNLAHIISKVPQSGSYHLTVSVITPYMPITSDGKTPDLLPFFSEISEAIAAAIKSAARTGGREGAPRVFQNKMFEEFLPSALDQASGGGKFRPSVRDLFYTMRPMYLARGIEIKYSYFSGKIVSGYESEHGEIEGLYREERGALYHPHTDQEIQLGTQEVEQYSRPQWLFNKLIVIEKMGYVEAVRSTGLHARYDCALASARGYTTRALKDIIDGLADTSEPLTVFCITDADAYGSKIFESLVEETISRGRRKIEVVYLGLHPWEAEQMGLQVEEIEKSSERKPVAQFIKDAPRRSDGKTWEEWLQTNRYELNAMGIPLFLSWLEQKLVEYGCEQKVIPPSEVLENEILGQYEISLRKKLSEQILAAAGIDKLVADAVARARLPLGSTDPYRADEWLSVQDDLHWRDYTNAVVRKMIGE